MSAARLLARRLPSAANRANAAGQLRSMGHAQSFVSMNILEADMCCVLKRGAIFFMMLIGC
eukprot:scaffold1783_cov119-Skeletonema_dohrnii-CCMP3373.AAC.1